MSDTPFINTSKLEEASKTDIKNYWGNMSYEEAMHKWRESAVRRYRKIAETATDQQKAWYRKFGIELEGFDEAKAAAYYSYMDRGKPGHVERFLKRVEELRNSIFAEDYAACEAVAVEAAGDFGKTVVQVVRELFKPSLLKPKPQPIIATEKTEGNTPKKLITGTFQAPAKQVQQQPNKHTPLEIGMHIGNNQNIFFSYDDRPYGLVLVGQTGFGKTSLMEHLIEQDIRDQTTAIVFDPHGELSERLLRIGAGINPQNILFCEIGNNLSYGFNPLEVRNQGDPLEESQTIDSLMQVFRKHWSDNPAYSFGSRVEWVLSNTARTILANPGYTLAEIPLLLHDKAFRDKLVRNVTNPSVQFFWGEYRQLESTRRPIDVWQMVESTVTRLTQFLANEWLYRVLYQAKGTINFHELIDSGKTIIFTLPIGKLGEEPAALLGSLLLGKLATTIFSRNEYGKAYPRLHVYIDEFPRFSTQLISSALFTQARKFNVGTTITLQTLSQIQDEVSRASILQAGNLIAFQCIGSDAEIIAKQMPLPDPVGLMKPEPILLYSQTAVEDIWQKGHPDEVVMDMRRLYLRIVDDLNREPKEEYFYFDTRQLLQEHPDWNIFTDWDMFRSSATMLRDGIARINAYFYDWMTHAYSMQVMATSGEVARLLKIIECISGYLGVRPVMQAYIPEDQRLFLLNRMQNQIEYLGDKHHLISSRTGEKSWKYKKLEDMATLETIPSLLTPTQLATVREFALYLRLSQYEIDKLIAWKVRSLLQEEAGSLTKAVMDMANLLLTKEQNPYSFDEYGTIVEVLSLQYINDAANTDLQERSRKYSVICHARGVWFLNELKKLVLYLRYIGSILEKEPLFAPSHSYHDVEMNRRTYSDLRDELVTKLVSLPPYNAICSLAAKSGELPIQILTPKPLTISPDAEPKAKTVREESKRKLGHPWQEVVKDIQTRQNLPPAKPQI